MKTAQDIILKPIITESTMDMTADKKYVFKVAPNSTKPEIASAVKELFKVDVKSVNTMNVKRKSKKMRTGRGYGFTSAWKKAIVTLTANSKTIEFFDGLN